MCCSKDRKDCRNREAVLFLPLRAESMVAELVRFGLSTINNQWTNAC